MTPKRQALGRGLAALIPAAAVPSVGSHPQTPETPGPGGGRAPGDAREGLRVVGIEEVHPARTQPRKAFDDARLDELAASIRSQGLIQPLVVRTRETGGYEIIAGERRWRAAQRAGLHAVAVVVREIAPARAFELAMVENLQREDLNPIEEAEGFDRLIREFGYTQESLASRVGKDRSTVANALRLLKLPPGVRSLVISGRLSMGHARAILGLESTSTPQSSSGSSDAGIEAMERLGRKAAGRELSVRQVEEIVRRERDRPPTNSPAPGPIAPTASARDLATRLSRALGARVRVVEAGTGRGYIEINYTSLDELDGLLAKLLP